MCIFCLFASLSFRDFVPSSAAGLRGPRHDPRCSLHVKCAVCRSRAPPRAPRGLSLLPAPPSPADDMPTTRHIMTVTLSSSSPSISVTVIIIITKYYYIIYFIIHGSLISLQFLHIYSQPVSVKYTCQRFNSTVIYFCYCTAKILLKMCLFFIVCVSCHLLCSENVCFSGISVKMVVIDFPVLMSDGQ